MKAIWKFPLAITDFQRVWMPQGADVLSMQVQGETPFLWAKVDSKAALEARGFWTLGTGNPIEHPERVKRHVGTYQLQGGALVFHVFEHQFD